MRRRQSTPCSSSESDGSDIDSCFYIEDEREESDAETELTGVDTDVDDVEATLPDLE